MNISELSARDVLTWVLEMRIARGYAYLMSKVHRITGILLSLYLVAHIYTLSGLENPTSFQREMDFLSKPFFMFLEWCLVIPLALHAFNGGRLILFELFKKRDDTILLRWSVAASIVFILFMGIVMMMGTQEVSMFLYWSVVVFGSVAILIPVWQKVRPTFNKTIWKVQRLTGAALFTLALGHYLFMHLNVLIGHNAVIILERMKNPAIVLIDFLLLSVASLHAWYGIQTIIIDIVLTSWIRKMSTVFLTFVTIVVYFWGLRLLFITMSS